VIFFINRTGFGALADELDQIYGFGRVTYSGPLKRDFGHVPYVDDWFREGVRRSSSNYVCFLNGDIILSANWLRRAKQIFRWMDGRSIVVIGRRINFYLNPTYFNNLSFGKTLLREIDVMVNQSKHFVEIPYAIDTFLFQIDHMSWNPDRVPPFLMGRPRWDNWLVGYLNVVCDTITVGLNPPVYHIKHKPNGFDIRNDRMAVNQYTWIGNKNYRGSNLDTTWRISDKTLVHRRSSFQIQIDFP
jgi:hypothetical protein